MDRGRLQAAALVLAKRLPYIPAVLAYSPRGPLYSSGEALAHLLQEGTKFLREQGCIGLEDGSRHPGKPTQPGWKQPIPKASNRWRRAWILTVSSPAT